MARPASRGAYEVLQRRLRGVGGTLEIDWRPMHVPRATFANVVSCLALFVALGGVSYAATSLPTNSVGTKQIKSGSVDNSKVKKGSLLRNAFKSGQLPAGKRGRASGASRVRSAPPASASSSPHPARRQPETISADGVWHTWTSSTFTAAANTIYQPVTESNFQGFAITGADCAGDAAIYFQRQLVNGAPTSAPDSNGFSYIPQFFGTYAAGTQVTLQYQYQVLCATQTVTLPAASVFVVPFQVS